MKRLAAWLLAALAAWTAYGLDYKTVDVRKTGQSPVRETFWAGDSIAFGYALEEGGYSYDLEPWDLVTWEMCNYTNPAQCWMAVTGRVDDAESGELSVETMLPLSVVPEGQYRGYVKGLKVTASNTVASQRVLVEQVVTVRYGQTEFPPDAEDNADILAGNAYARISDVEAEAAERQHADNILSNAIAVISTAGGGEPIWKVGYLPAKEDEREEGDTNVAYTVESQVTFPEGVKAGSLTLGDEEITSWDAFLRPWPGWYVLDEEKKASMKRLGFGVYMLPNVHAQKKLVLYSGELPLVLESWATNGIVLQAKVQGEEEGETSPGPILMEGNAYVDGDFGVDGDVSVTDDVAAGSFTLDDVTWTEWPDLSGIERNAGNIATNAGNIATNAHDIAVLQGAVSTNAARIEAVNERIDRRIDSLWGECKGGYKWPDYFRVLDYMTAVKNSATTTEVVFTTNTAYNIVETLAANYTMLGWQINTDVIRKENEDDAILWEPYRLRWIDRDKTHMPVVRFSMNPDLLEASGNMVYFKDGVEPEAVDASFAMVRGTLGSHTVDVRLDYDSALQATNNVVCRFVGPAPGSLMAQCWSNIFETASNGWAQTPRRDMGLRLWPEGYGSTTNHVTATWNTNFWAYGLGDFSCISYHSDAKPGYDGGVYRPITMVTPRHGICADHYTPMTGSNCYWVTRSNSVATNRIIARKRIRSDLTVVRLDHAFDTNDIMPAKLLADGYGSYTYGSTNKTHDCIGFPVLSFDCAERGWVSGWKPYSLNAGRNGKRNEDSFFATGAASIGNAKYEGPYKGNGCAVGGDSGSPTFLLVDGQTILLGCFYTAPGGGPMPRKDEVDEAIRDTWGDEDRCVVYDLGTGGWYNPDIPQPPH